MILITRPQVESNILAKELLKYNIKTCTEPLISFSHNENIFFKNMPANYILSSTRSVDVLEKNFSRLKNILERGDFYIIGEKVKSKLQALGLKNVIGTFDNSPLLIQSLSQKHFNSNPFIYLCGNVFNSNLLEEIKNLGINIEEKFLYKTIQRKKLTKKTVQLIDNGKIDAVVLFSSYTAKTFIQLISNEKLVEKAKNLHIFCLSFQIANILKQNQFQHVDYCKLSNQEEMIQMLKSHKIFEKQGT